jgi:hypothetical protein
MFSIIINIISIALVAALALALAHLHYSNSLNRRLERIRRAGLRREALRAFGASFAARPSSREAADLHTRNDR